MQFKLLRNRNISDIVFNGCIFILGYLLQKWNNQEDTMLSVMNVMKTLQFSNAVVNY